MTAQNEIKAWTSNSGVRQSRPFSKVEVDAAAAPLHAVKRSASGAGRERRRVAVLANEAFGVEIASGLEHFGMVSAVLTSPESLVAQIEPRGPDAIVVDLDGFGDAARLLGGLHELVRRDSARLVLVCLSQDRRFEARRQALRYGCSVYLPKPVDTVRVCEVVDGLLPKAETSPYRVLLIDDDADYLGACQRGFAAAGFSVYASQFPEHTMGDICDPIPDLIIINLQMRSCSAIELAAVIRQSPELTATPIVFLCEGDDQERQIEAMGHGADAFVQRSSDLTFLLRVAEIKAARARELRRLIAADSLTGLLNHGHFVEALSREIQRQQRFSLPLSLAMLDLDFFKRINDGYGHPIGDHVLRNFCRVLREQLRSSDVVGRYGGDEFGCVFVGASAEQASETLVRVRQYTNALSFAVGTETLGVSFSAGVVDVNPSRSVMDNVARADTALYAAKSCGRNRTVIGGVS